MVRDLTRDELARLLREAEKAHAEFERDLGGRDRTGRPGTPTTSCAASRAPPPSPRGRARHGA